MGRGGRRPGAGRKALEGERRTITLRLPLDAYAILEALAEEGGENKTQVCARLLREKKK